MSNPKADSDASHPLLAGPLHTPKEASRRERIPEATLAYWRHIGKGPAYIRMPNGSISYTDGALDAHRRQALVIPGATGGKAE